MKLVRLVLVGLCVLVLAGLAWRFTHSDAASSSPPGASSAVVPMPTASASAEHALPRAVRDQAKRDEMRSRLRAAMEEAQRTAEAEKARAAVTAGQPSVDPNVRGNRETNDLKEFGRFVSQAIKEDFLPMAKACAKELAARKPDAGGNVRVAFTLLGDTKIGGVVDEAHIDEKESSIQDAGFETCMRESMYGVYFDPPPAGGMATLNFDVNVLDNGDVDEEVPDFSGIKDRRNEKP